jgi:hypothetical protein
VNTITDDIGPIDGPGPACDVSGLGFDPDQLMCFSFQVPRWFYVAVFTTYGYCGSGHYKYETATLAYELECQVPTFPNLSNPNGWGWYYSVSFSSGTASNATKFLDHAGPVEPGIFFIIGKKSSRQAFTQMQVCWHHDLADIGCYLPGGGLSVGYGR